MPNLSKRLPIVGSTSLVFAGIMLSWAWWQPSSARNLTTAPPTEAKPAQSVTDQGASQPIEVPVAEETSASASKPAGKKPTDEEAKKIVLGEWKGNFHGPRTLSVQTDGTAILVSFPEGIGATLFAKRLEFNIKWTLEKGNLAFETTGGKPEGKVKLIERLYGKRRNHEILEITPEKMVLLDEDGETQYEWFRVTESEKIEPSAEKLPAQNDQKK